MAIQEHKFSDLAEFWQFISPDGDLIQRMGMTARPIFRGQGNASWPLAPSALRQKAINQHKRSIYRQTDHVMSFEYELLSAYAHYCDEMGLAIPGDSHEFRQKSEFFTFAEEFGSSANEWPTEVFYPLLASAQHHGVPTRLLDWTRSSFVAAYFAGIQALDLMVLCGPLTDDIVVWCVDAREVHLIRHEATNAITEVHHLALPGITSKNLAAQKGCFLLVKWIVGQSRDADFDIGTTIDEILRANADVTLHKVVLSHQHVGDLIFKCKDYGFSAATLFPGYDGAGKAAKEFKLAKSHSGRL